MHRSNTVTRNAIRREMRARRRLLGNRERADASTALADNAFSLHRLRTARNLAAYLSVQGEISLDPIIEHAWSLRIPVYVPRLRGLSLEFHRYLPDTPLEKNRFGIPEPTAQSAVRINPRFLDVVLTPLVAFDANGGRLGTGGGYYDRTFSFLRQRTHWRKPSLLGVAYAFQQVDDLPVAAWDVPLEGIITDDKIFLA